MRKFLIGALVIASCGSPSTDLCSKYNTLYPDLISQRVETLRNTELVQGGRAYAAGDYESAITHFTNYSDVYLHEPLPYFYKAICQLQLERPYEAELTLDMLETLKDKSFNDQAEFYNVVCLLCSKQNDRALALAKKINAKNRHSYSQQLNNIIDELSP